MLMSGENMVTSSHQFSSESEVDNQSKDDDFFGVYTSNHEHAYGSANQMQPGNAGNGLFDKQDSDRDGLSSPSSDSHDGSDHQESLIRQNLIPTFNSERKRAEVQP